MDGVYTYNIPNYRFYHSTHPWPTLSGLLLVIPAQGKSNQFYAAIRRAIAIQRRIVRNVLPPHALKNIIH